MILPRFEGAHRAHWKASYQYFLISGEFEVSGGDIVIEAVSRHDAGTYQCVARDDYGLEPVTREVQLFVECK